MSSSNELADREDHPIKVIIANVLKDGEGDQEKAVFEAEGLQVIEQAVDLLIETNELFPAVETVLLVVHALEHQQDSPIAAGQLLDIVERDVVIDAMKKVNEKRNAGKEEEAREGVEQKAEDFRGFAGKESDKQAPTQDEEDPEDSVKLGDLDFPKRL